MLTRIIAALLLVLGLGVAVAFAQAERDDLKAPAAPISVLPASDARLVTDRPAGLQPGRGDKGRAPTPEMPKRLSSSAKLAMMDTRLADFLMRNQSLAEMQGLLQDQRFNRLTLALQSTLRLQADALVVERDALLPNARRLDADQSWLIGESQQIKASESVLAEAGRELERQVLQHNSTCAPAPDEQTYRWCLQDEARVRKLQADHNARVGDHNRRVKAYLERFDNHRPRRETFVGTLTAWADRIKSMVRRIRLALDNPPDKDKQTCVWTGRRIPPENGVCEYDCTTSGIILIPPSHQGDPCPRLRLDVPIPPAARAR